MAPIYVMKSFYCLMVAAILLFVAGLVLFLIPLQSNQSDSQNEFEEAVNNWVQLSTPGIFKNTKIQFRFDTVGFKSTAAPLN